MEKRCLAGAGSLDRTDKYSKRTTSRSQTASPSFFEIVSAHLRKEEEAKALDLLTYNRETMLGARKESRLCGQMDKLGADFPASLPLAEMVASLYAHLNRGLAEMRDALVRLFDLYMVAAMVKEACEALDKLVDIDPYDYRNQQRIASLEGKVDPAFLQNILSRAAKAATVSTRTEGFTGAGSEVGASAPVSEEVRAQQALDDLIVQVEIFLQYSLQTKAIERLERIAELFPGEEDRNERLRALYERANWWPKGVPPKPKPAAVAPPPVAQLIAEPQPPPQNVASSSATETHRDLAAIAEVNRLMYRQPSPREVLATTAAQAGRHLGVTRCLISVGRPGEAGQVIAEFVTPGVAPANASLVPSLLNLLSSSSADAPRRNRIARRRRASTASP